MKLGFKISLMMSFLIGGFLLVVLRLADIQLLRGDFFNNLSQDNRFYTLPIKAQRGVLLDRYDQPLVQNKLVYSLVSDPKVLYANLQVIGRDEALAHLATNSAMVMKNHARYLKYPQLSSVIGYVGEVTAEELEERADLKPHDWVGKLGLEKAFDGQLRGEDGKEVFEISATSKKQRSVSRIEQVSGENIKTTLDAQLSKIAEEALGEQRGVVIIADAKNGEILSLVTKPSFDANLFTKNSLDEEADRARRQQIAGLFADEGQPFFNRAIAGAYPPGSVFKLVTALAGLEYGEVDRGTTVLDEGILKVGESEFRSWFYWNYGKTEGLLDLRRAIMRSNDIFFYKVAEWVGAERLAEMAKVFGFGDYTGIEIGPETRGLVPTPEWKERTIGEKWYLGNTYHMGIGQGDVLTSPLQINGMIQAVANEGVWCQPKLVMESKGECRGLGLAPENLELVLSGMLDACSSGGTAFPFFERNGKLRSEAGSVMGDIHAGAVACKTGTAEFGAADERGYKSTHGWLVMMVEPKVVGKKENFPKKIVITVLVESDENDSFKEGSYDAAPVAAEILEFIEGNY